MAIPPTVSNFENAAVTQAILDTTSDNTMEYQLDTSIENHMGNHPATGSS